jgi:hypothetical protein
MTLRILLGIWESAHLAAPTNQLKLLRLPSAFGNRGLRQVLAPRVAGATRRHQYTRRKPAIGILVELSLLARDANMCAEKCKCQFVERATGPRIGRGKSLHVRSQN